MPVAAGVNDKEYGNVVSVPSSMPLARNWMLVMVAGAVGVATALRVPVLLTARFAGTVTTTPAGAVPTVTRTAAEVVLKPVSLVATAVRESAPAVVGV